MKLFLSIFLSLLISSANAGLDEAVSALKTGDFKTAIFNIEKEIKKVEEEDEDDTFLPFLHEMLARTYYRAPDDVDNDYKLAFEHFQVSTKNFDAGVQHKLGFMYYTGQGVEKDYAKAIEHLENSLKYKEKSESLLLLGKIYLAGHGVDKDYEKAKEYFERADKEDDANSQFELGHIHEYGKGVPVSIPRALYYYEKAAKKGDSDAQYKIDIHTGKIAKKDRNIAFEQALDYTYGYTVDTDIDKAIDLYQQAADAGDSTSLYNIGFLIGMNSPVKRSVEENEYYKKSAEMGNVYAQTVLSYNYSLGSGVEMDKEKAFYWETQAALNGNLDSIKNVASSYYSGIGISKNYDEAIKWYQKAVDMGDKESIYSLATMYEEGEGFEQDTDKAIELYTRVADLGYGEAQNILSKYYFKGTYVKRDYQKSYDLAVKAANQGIADAQNKLGTFYMTGKGVVEIDMEKALDYFEKAAEQGNTKAQNNLGRIYLTGTGVKKDKAKAYTWFIKAADMGDADSQYQIGNMYDFGVGVQKDVNKAIDWYEEASLKDNKRAQIALGSVYYYGDEDAGILKNYKKAAAYYYSAAKNDKDEQSKKEITLTPTSSGSGFFVTPNHIITNNHVTENCDEIEVKNKSYKSKVELLDTDSTTDLSILETGKAHDSYLFLRDRKAVQTGEQSIALGYPFSSTLGSELKVTTGNIAALTGFNNNIAELQLTSPVQPGNSGGPLVDDNGNVIGVIVSRLETSSEITGDRAAQNVNFAIKSNMAKIFMDLNKVDYQERKANGSKTVSQIVTDAKEATVQVICKEKE